MAGMTRDQRIEKSSICLFLPDLGGGGAERAFVRLANGFSQRGSRITLVLARAEGVNRSLVDPGIEVLDLGRSRTRDCLLDLCFLLRRRRPEVLLVTLEHASVVAAAAHWLSGRGTRLVIRQANVPEALRGSASLGGHLRQLALGLALRRATAIVAVANSVRIELLGTFRLDPARIQVIGGPFLEDKTGRVEVSAADPTRPRPITAAGRLSEQKDFSTLIRAFARIADSIPHDLVIYGEGPMREPLESLIQVLRLAGRVSLPGFVPELQPHLSQASCFVLSSAWEGLPGVLVEGLDSGCSVVATDCPGGVRELMTDPPIGELVSVGDDEGMAAAILRALGSRPDRHLTQRVVEPFRVGAVVERYLDLFFPERPSPPSN